MASPKIFQNRAKMLGTRAQLAFLLGLLCKKMWKCRDLELWRHEFGVNNRQVLQILSHVSATVFMATVGFDAPQHTVSGRLDQFGDAVRRRVAGRFTDAGVSYPPKQVAYLVFKDTDLLQVYARGSTKASWKWVTEYRIQGASGGLGPKLRQGDLQVPEGIYRAELLNPNSRFHVSIRVNYPNAFDRKHAKAEERTQLGGDIMIHGSNVSIGCMAMGDEVAEDLFALAALAGIRNVQIVISPTDFRRKTTVQVPTEPAWVRTLYSNLRSKLRSFPLRK